MNHSQLFDQFILLPAEERLLFVRKLIKLKLVSVSLDLDDPIIGVAMLDAIADQIRQRGESLGK